MSFTDLEKNKSKDYDMDLYDCVVIGTGTSSEPVIYHLSKTNLKTLIIDASDIYEEYSSIDSGQNSYISNLTPKQNFSHLKVHNKKKGLNITPNVTLKCSKFSYLFSFTSGGLSNFWGGGLFDWPESEIKKVTSIPYEMIKKSYKNIKNRLQILSRDQFLQKSSFANSFMARNKEFMPKIFQPSKFFISREGLLKHEKYKEHFDQNIIWKSSHTIREYLKGSENLKYQSKTVALSIRKNTKFRIIYCKQNNKFISIKTKAIFLCSGVLNSTYLAFSALNMNKASIKLNHSFAAIVPIVYFGFLSRFNKKNIELPDLSWTLIPKDINISGYLLSSYFLHKKLTLTFDKLFFKVAYKIVEKVLPSLAFFTLFTDSKCTETTLRIKRIQNDYSQFDRFTLEISNNNIPSKKNKYISDKLKKLKKFIRGRFYLLNFITKYASTGGDIHYGSTMPDENIMKNVINTSSIGEICNCKNIFVCDPSRMGYISSLPHTFTSMAIIDASMPLIIKRLR